MKSHSFILIKGLYNCPLEILSKKGEAETLCCMTESNRKARSSSFSLARKMYLVKAWSLSCSATLLFVHFAGLLLGSLHALCPRMPAWYHSPSIAPISGMRRLGVREAQKCAPSSTGGSAGVHMTLVCLTRMLLLYPSSSGSPCGHP